MSILNVKTFTAPGGIFAVSAGSPWPLQMKQAAGLSVESLPLGSTTLFVILQQGSQSSLVITSSWLYNAFIHVILQQAVDIDANPTTPGHQVPLLFPDG